MIHITSTAGYRMFLMVSLQIQQKNLLAKKKEWKGICFQEAFAPEQRNFDIQKSSKFFKFKNGNFTDIPSCASVELFAGFLFLCPPPTLWVPQASHRNHCFLLKSTKGVSQTPFPVTNIRTRTFLEITISINSRGLFERTKKSGETVLKNQEISAKNLILLFLTSSVVFFLTKFNKKNFKTDAAKKKNTFWQPF